jgi:hypothetical protein
MTITLNDCYAVFVVTMGRALFRPRWWFVVVLECRQNKLARLCQTNCKYYGTKLCYEIFHRKVYFFRIDKKFVRGGGLWWCWSVVKTIWHACAKPIANIMEPNYAMKFFIAKCTFSALTKNDSSKPIIAPAFYFSYACHCFVVLAPA